MWSNPRPFDENHLVFFFGQFHKPLAKLVVDGDVVIVSKSHDIVAALWIATFLKLDAVYFVIRVDHDIFKFLLFDVVFIRHRDSKRTVSFYVFF